MNDRQLLLETARVLNRHVWVKGKCHCGWEREAGFSHAEHVAASLYAKGLLANPPTRAPDDILGR